MNFFDAQDRARRATRRLVIAYAVATALIIAGVTAIMAFAIYGHGQQPEPAVLVVTAVATALLILGASAYKTARLNGGGGQVARDLGGTQVPPGVSDPLRRRLRNVVEEMAIASGVPVPEIYVLEQEAGINAFAAGFAPGDAAIAVTRGTLEILNRDELQGVVAHEFSHVLNGDMRLNIRMMGVLFGIMVLGLIGRLITRGSYHGNLMSSRRGKGSGPVIVIGLGLMLLGSVGVFFARLVKAAVSRQREFLADASAVQFTRQTDGIANALKKIAGYKRESYFQATDPEEVSHMLFAQGARFSSLFATHPPLAERIKALDPNFRMSDIGEVDLPVTGDIAGVEERVAGFAAASSAAVTPEAISNTIGNPTLEHVVYAATLRSGLPEELYAAAHAPGTAWLLALALFIDSREQQAAPAFELLLQQLGEARCNRVRDIHSTIAAGDDRWRLPLLEIAFPALRQTPRPQLQFLVDLGRRLIELDGHISLREFCLFRILERDLQTALGGSSRPIRRNVARDSVRDAAIGLLAIVATRGHEDRNKQSQAFAAGIAGFGDWAKARALPQARATAAELQDILDTLQFMNNAARRSMVDAVAAAITADRKLTATEAELLRAICATLNCPLPPLRLREQSD